MLTVYWLDIEGLTSETETPNLNHHKLTHSIGVFMRGILVLY